MCVVSTTSREDAIIPRRWEKMDCNCNEARIFRVSVPEIRRFFFLFAVSFRDCKHGCYGVRDDADGKEMLML